MIVITDALERKLMQVAERKNQTITEILEDYADAALIEAETQDANPLLTLAKMADSAGAQFHESDTALRSRELLEQHFARDLSGRIENGEK